MTDLCLRRWPRTAWNVGLRKLCWLVPYILLSLVPMAGAFLPDSPVKFALQAAGNVWLGFYLYYGWLLLMLLGLRQCSAWPAGEGWRRTGTAAYCACPWRWRWR